jgi:hypothetical protein
MAVSWCKVASNLDSHPKIRKAGRLGREVFLFALRRNAEPGNKVPGQISADELDPDYLSDMLQMPRDEAVTGVTSLVTAGLLAREGDVYVITSWKDGWGKDNGGGAARTAKWRENNKLRTSLSQRDARDVTDVTRDACDTEEKRREENKETGSPEGLARLFDKVDQAGGDVGKERNASAAKRKAAANPDHQSAIDGFHERFKAAYGTKPTWNGKAIGLLSSLLKRHSLSVVLERMDLMFAGTAKWPPPPYSAEVFVQHFDRWVDVSPRPTTPYRRVDEL